MRAHLLAALSLLTACALACASAPKKAEPPPEPPPAEEPEPEALGPPPDGKVTLVTADIAIEPDAALPKGTVVRQTLEVTPDVRRCYRETLRTTPEAAYRLVLTVGINKTGHGDLVQAEGDGLDDAGRECLKAAVSEWFYEMPSGESAELTLPFDVAPGAD